jgi:hypothetical protein
MYNAGRLGLSLAIPLQRELFYERLFPIFKCDTDAHVAMHLSLFPILMPLRSIGPQVIGTADLRRSSMGTLTLLPCLNRGSPLHRPGIDFLDRVSA